ncbi:hypothetical protein [Meridianimarinicoccus aquatilis]|uniref:Uncharacterized protein n=1 Tax=Meridianimarinicoccus aquatilis TaxID=2552766 RepID=A0A4R6AWA9_9RHOB|nr:hypothetical protein [Fluviibacterium aquatile]TDL88991.1 hypothetical protein E2L05_08495 [Fluviibacterium aquatile]
MASNNKTEDRNSLTVNQSADKRLPDIRGEARYAIKGKWRGRKLVLRNTGSSDIVAKVQFRNIFGQCAWSKTSIYLFTSLLLANSAHAATMLSAQVNRLFTETCSSDTSDCGDGISVEADLFAGDFSLGVVGLSKASAKANEETGELKIYGEITTTNTSTRGEQARADASISGSFTTTGAGTLTAYLFTEGSYYAYDVDDYGNDQAVLDVSSILTVQTAGTGLDFNTEQYIVEDNWENVQDHGTGERVEMSGTIGDWLVVSRQVSVGQRVTIRASVGAGLASGYGFFDFGNTSKLFVTTSEGLSIFAADSNPGFLSNPALSMSDLPGATVVPLPAGIVLGLSSLALLGALKARRKI